MLNDEKIIMEIFTWSFMSTGKFEIRINRKYDINCFFCKHIIKV